MTHTYRFFQNVRYMIGAALILTFVVALLLVWPMTATRAVGVRDSKGTDFWLMFNGNLGSPELNLFITGDTNTSGTVEIPGMGFSVPFAITAGTVTTVPIPTAVVVDSSSVIENKGVHVMAQDEITVYGLNRVQFTTDAFLGLPTDILGTEYIVLGFGNVNIVNGTQFGIVAPEDNTTVTITPSVATDGHAAGVPYTVILNRGQVYQLRNTDPSPNDLSGTIVASNKSIAVFGSHQCANVPDGSTLFCDNIVEQLPPTETWGKNFVTMPLATRLGGDTFRFIASRDSTHVSLNGVLVATLNRGQFHQQIITGPAQITADQPIMVAQYSNGTTFDSVTSDPFMMLIPPFEQFLGSYTVTTPASGFADNYINVVAPNEAIGSIVLDGVPIPSGSFTPIGSSGFSGAQLTVSIGSHNLSGPLPFGAFMYGYASFDSYGYPGGMSLAPVVRVTSVALVPKTSTNPINTQHCVTATVLDQQGMPVKDVRVDFNVVGANTTAGFASTDVNGQAQFCYTGTNAGTDTIRASVGTIADTATKIWFSNKPPVAVCRNITVSAGASCVANASIDNGSFDPDGDPFTLVQSPAGPYPLGNTTVTLTVTDDEGASDSCTATVTVKDSTPPAISAVSATPDTLWSPNHKMTDVTLNYGVADNCATAAAMTCTLSINSNEPINGLGDGNHSPDWEIVDAHHVRLRAERSGKGTGRIYTITTTCADNSGNSSRKTLTVSVSKSQK